MKGSNKTKGQCFNPMQLKRHSRTNRKALQKVSQACLTYCKIPITPTSLKYLICDACRLKIRRKCDSDNKVQGKTRNMKSSGRKSPIESNIVVMASTSAPPETQSNLNVLIEPIHNEETMDFEKGSITLMPAAISIKSITEESSSIEELQTIHETNDKKIIHAGESHEGGKALTKYEDYFLASRLTYTFRGHIAPVLTPFLDDSTRSLNLSAIRQYAEFLADRGVTGVLVNGTSGEGPSMSVEERKSVAEAWASAVKSTKQHLMIQVGGAPLPDVLELAKHAEKIGADSLLCLPELYFKPTTPEQLVEYLQVVGQAAPRTPLLYYHVPIFSNVNINMAKFFEAIGERIPSFVGIKFTSPCLDEATQALHVNNKEFVIFLGNDQIMAGAFALGLDSAIATSLNIVPELAIEILNASTSGNLVKARESQERLSKFVIAVTKYGGWVETMKLAVALLTPFDVGPPRFPINPVSAESAASMKAGLQSLGYRVLR